MLHLGTHSQLAYHHFELCLDVVVGFARVPMLDIQSKACFHTHFALLCMRAPALEGNRESRKNRLLIDKAPSPGGA